MWKPTSAICGILVEGERLFQVQSLLADLLNIGFRGQRQTGGATGSLENAEADQRYSRKLGMCLTPVATMGSIREWKTIR